MRDPKVMYEEYAAKGKSHEYMKALATAIGHSAFTEYVKGMEELFS